MVEEGHFAGEEVKTKLWELHGRWDTLKAKASKRRQDLEDSLQAQQYLDVVARLSVSWVRGRSAGLAQEVMTNMFPALLFQTVYKL
ncbi:spectrin alpha chain, non-erythrocytic 1-like [Nothobranchius furzeri]|uniref:spectrin alpha chain, non-erythrocytic 1-like n=1 Tax=Nothobranchius furzeri TaxID=105023 RepID=UPI003904AE04